MNFRGPIFFFFTLKIILEKCTDLTARNSLRNCIDYFESFNLTSDGRRRTKNILNLVMKKKKIYPHCLKA